MKTQAAKAAKQIKQQLKKAFPNVKFSVTSENFSMGNSVNISYEDGPKSDDVRAITDKHQYGNFNGMEDIYEYSNKREDIYQAKYVSVSRTWSEETKAALMAEIEEDFGITIENEFTGYSELGGQDAITFAHREFSQRTL